MVMISFDDAGSATSAFAVVVKRSIRMKRHAQQSALATTQDSTRDVEERRRLQHAISYDANASALFDDEHSSVVQGLSQEYRCIQTSRKERVELEGQSRGRSGAAVTWTGRITVTSSKRNNRSAIQESTNQ
jgi:hypothetical protein